MDSSRQRDIDNGESMIQPLDVRPGAYREVEIVSCSGPESTVNLVENISLLEAMEAEIKASDPPPVNKGYSLFGISYLPLILIQTMQRPQRKSII